MIALASLSFIALIAITVLAIVSRDLSHNQLEAGLLSRLKVEYAMPGGEELTRVVDLLQSDLQCCGVSGPADYARTDWQAGGDSEEAERLRLPLTCCALADQQRGAEGDAFLDPRPLNLTLCQSQSQDRFRHSKVEFWESDKTKIHSYNWTFQGCKPLVENYVSQELVIIVGMSLGPSVANVIVLSVTAFFWRNIITK